MVSTYTDLNASEHTIRDFRNRFLEVYVPLRDYETGAIVAVAEIHETTEPLERNLRWLRIEAWFAVVALALLIMLSLFGIVRRASGLIGRQRASLIEQMDALREASDQNAALRERVQQASIRASAANENHLRQVGAELHDGPAQLIGLAALKVDMVRQAGKVARDEILSSLSAILKEALRDIRRTISKGLMLPEIAGLPLDEVVRRVCRVHEQRTGTIVDMDCGANGLRRVPPHQDLRLSVHTGRSEQRVPPCRRNRSVGALPMRFRIASGVCQRPGAQVARTRPRSARSGLG